MSLVRLVGLGTDEHQMDALSSTLHPLKAILGQSVVQFDQPLRDITLQSYSPSRDARYKNRPRQKAFAAETKQNLREVNGAEVVHQMRHCNLVYYV